MWGENSIWSILFLNRFNKQNNITFELQLVLYFYTWKMYLKNVYLNNFLNSNNYL